MSKNREGSGLRITECNIFLEDADYIDSKSKVRGDKAKFIREAVRVAVELDRRLKRKDVKRARE